MRIRPLLGAVLALACDPTPRQPPSVGVGLLWNGDFTAFIQLVDEGGAFSNLTVQGPGVAGTLTGFSYDPGSHRWSIGIFFGPNHPAPLPLEYVVGYTDGGQQREARVTVPCFVETLPAPVAPAPDASVASPVVFEWAPVAGTGIRYDLAVGQQKLSLIDRTSATLALPSGSYASFWIEAFSSTRECWAHADGGPFTVQ